MTLNKHVTKAYLWQAHGGGFFTASFEQSMTGRHWWMIFIDQWHKKKMRNALRYIKGELSWVEISIDVTVP
jgi:hypothetical protein